MVTREQAIEALRRVHDPVRGEAPHAADTEERKGKMIYWTKYRTDGGARWFAIWSRWFDIRIRRAP